MSETEQICTHSNMNDFQHKNVCKTIDINTRTCYYIDNTRTCYTTTKQEARTMKTTLKSIRGYVATNAAEDLTKKRFAEIDTIRVAECGFETIAYSTGIYGITGVLVKGNTTGKLYAVTARTSALFQVM